MLPQIAIPCAAGPSGAACQAISPSRDAASPSSASASVIGPALVERYASRSCVTASSPFAAICSRPAPASSSGSTTAWAGTSRSSRNERL